MSAAAHRFIRYVSSQQPVHHNTITRQSILYSCLAVYFRTCIYKKLFLNRGETTYLIKYLIAFI